MYRNFSFDNVPKHQLTSVLEEVNSIQSTDGDTKHNPSPPLKFYINVPQSFMDNPSMTDTEYKEYQKLLCNRNKLFSQKNQLLQSPKPTINHSFLKQRVLDSLHAPESGK